MLRRTVVGDGLLRRRGDHDGNVAVRVKIVLVSEDLAGVFDLFAGVPFRRDQHLEPAAVVRQEVGVRLRLSENICCKRVQVALLSDAQISVLLSEFEY